VTLQGDIKPLLEEKQDRVEKWNKSLG